jgi:PAS domain S-box-containing protein
MFLAVATIPLLLVGALTFHNYEDSLEANHLSQLQNIAAYKADRIEAYFTGVTSNIKIAQGLYNIKKNLPVLLRFSDDPNNPESQVAKKQLGEQLLQMESVLWDVSDIMLLDLEGKVVYANKAGHYSKNLSNSPFDAEQKAFSGGKDKVCLSDIYFDKSEDNRFEMLVTAPAYDLSGVSIGVIALEVDMANVYKLVQDAIGLGNTGETLIGKKIGNQVVFLNPLRHDPNAALVRTRNIGDKTGIGMQNAVQGTGAGQYIDYRGKKVVGAWRYIPSLDWGIVAKIDADEAFADVTNLRNLIFLILAIIFVLSGIMAFSIAQSISVPIKRLSEGARIIGSGNLDYKIGTNLKDEIGQLSRSFDKMTSDLKQTLASREELSIEVRERKQAAEALWQSEQQLARSQEIAHLGSWELDLANDKLSWSDEVYRIFGLQPQEFDATYEAFLERVHPDDRATVDEAYAASIREGKDGYEIEHRVIKKPTGEIRYVHERCEHFRDDSGKIIRSVGMVHDITERKHVAERLEMVAKFPSENPSPVLRIASDGMILYSNGPGSSLLEEWGRGVGQESPKAWSEQVARALDCGQNIVQEVTCGNRIISLVLAPVTEGGYVNLYGRDITKERKASQALRRAHAELEKKVQERTAELVQTVGLLREEAEQRMQAQEAVKAERQRFNDVLETLPAYVCLLTPDYYMPFANRVFREWFGYYPDKKCHEFLFNRAEPCETCETFTVLKTNKSHHWEWTGPNGRNYDIFDFPFTDTDGSRLILEMGIDVTEAKWLQKELQSASLYTRGLIEASLDPLVTISQDGKITDVNKATELVTGTSREQLIGTDFSNYFTEPDHARKGYQKVFAEGFVTDYPLTIRRRDGRLTDVLYNAAVYRSESGEVVGVFAAARDITEKKAAEEEQSVTNSLLDLFAKKTTRKDYLDSTAGAIRTWSGCEFAGIRVRDNDGNIPYESYVGFDKEFLSLESRLHLERDKCVCIRAILENPQKQERHLMTAGGSFCCNDSFAFLDGLSEEHKKEYRANCIKKGFRSISVVPIRYRDEVLGAIHLTDYKKDMVLPPKVHFIESTIAPLIGEAIHRFNAEEELDKYRLSLEDLVKQRTEELARSNKDLEQFAYVASHDLQEPLRAVAGFVELLKRNLQGSLDAKTTQYMHFTVDGAMRMQSLISGLLEYSRIGTRAKGPQQTDSGVALKQAIASLQTSIKESGAEITSDGLPVVYFDNVQLSQLFQNLIGNAIKFRAEQAPRIYVSAVRLDDRWRFAVADNGIGIDPQYAERIFLIFQRLHNREKYPGTGIGLSICKKIVERHDGKIWVESKPGHGSTFYFTIADKGGPAG